MIVVGGWPGRNVVGLNGRFGVRPADFAIGGDFDNPFEDDADLPGDATTEFAGVVQSLPGSGDVTFDDLGAFTHTGAADGTYATVFTLYTWAQGGPITEHTPDETITTQFGATAAAGATVQAASSLIAGGAGGGAAGQTLTAAASLIAGSASGAGTGTAAGETLTATAALTAGAATGQQNQAADGATMAAAASLLPGAATGGAEAAGVTLTAAASLIPGDASAAAGSTAAGASWAASAVLITGGAAGEHEGEAPGATLTLVSSILAGGAYGPIVAATQGFIANGAAPIYDATIGADGINLPRRRRA